MKTILLLAFATTAFADQAAMDILHRTAETYRKMGRTESNVTIQMLRNGGARVSEHTAMRAVAFDQVDEHVKDAEISREERYIEQGKPVAIVIVRVVRDQWPEGTLAGAQFAMYRIGKQTYQVYKVSTYAASATEIDLYEGGAPAATAEGSEAEASMIGMEAPDFTLADTSGKLVHLEDLRGKVVVVDFWATWCGPCRALMPQIQKMHEQWASKGLVVRGLDVGEEAGQVTKSAKKNSYTFRLLLDAEPEVTSRYFVQAYPTTFVIDSAGRIVLRDTGSPNADELKAAVRKALSVD